jgi:hypothetical protein
MRNLKLVDAVVQLRDIALLVEDELGTESISNEIRQIADRLHLYSIDDDKASKITQEIIKQVKE